MKKVLLGLGMFLSMLMVCAEDNVLQSIEIVPVKDTYNIVLVADKAVDVKKSVQAPNKITLDMKGIRASKTLSTVYNNVSNVDTVMVEPSGNGISVFFQAENAEGASVSFDSIAPAAPAKTEQKIKLSSPIESYAPIYREDVQEKTSSLFDKLTKKSTALGNDLQENIDESAASDTANKAFSFLLVGALAFAVIKLFKRKEPDMKIGLSQSLNEREIDMYRGEAPIGSAYIPQKPFTTVNYGLNAYKKENQNPYEQEVMQIHNPRLRSYSNNLMSETVQTPAQQPMRTNSTITAPRETVKRTAVQAKPVQAAQSNPNLDNIKFLESMTAIYEKSGRHDLAQGLKSSLMKNNVQ